MFRYHILGLLRCGEPLHGYALVKAYHRRTGRPVGPGNFYRELQRLMLEGLVRALPPPPRGDQRRAPYEITDDGLAAFDDWFCNIPRATNPGDSELAARAVFFREMEPTWASRVVDRWRTDLWQISKSFERELKDAMSRTRGQVDAHPILLRRRIRHIAAELEFLEELETAFALPINDDSILIPPVAARESQPVMPASKNRRK
jgi:DNA-binding PadR family transcriptional regulator